MPPIRSLRNQYRGINAHLHSEWQNRGGWDSFHALHLSDLTRSLNQQLAPLGCEADFEKSLQSWHPADGDETSQPVSDITIYDSDYKRARRPAAPIAGGSGEVVLPVPELLALDDTQIKTYRAVAIYPLSDPPGSHRVPVGWIELLSPSNKPPYSGFQSYSDKRRDVLASGIIFIELDYLHQTGATFERLPSYQPRRRGDLPDAGAAPYRITVVDPRPHLLDGLGRSHGFHVDDPIPEIVIPLSGTDALVFDFDAPYRRTFEEMLYGRRVDYAQLPLAFERYQPDDRARILNRLIAVLRAVLAGLDLDRAAPLLTSDLPLEAAEAEFRRLSESL